MHLQSLRLFVHRVRLHSFRKSFELEPEHSCTIHGQHTEDFIYIYRATAVAGDQHLRVYRKPNTRENFLLRHILLGFGRLLLGSYRVVVEVTVAQCRRVVRLLFGDLLLGLLLRLVLLQEVDCYFAWVVGCSMEFVSDTIAEREREREREREMQQFCNMESRQLRVRRRPISHCSSKRKRNKPWHGSR